MASVGLRAGWVCLMSAALAMVAGGCRTAASDPSAFHTKLTPAGSGIAERPGPADYSNLHADMTGVPHYRAGSGEPFQVDLRSCDLSRFDLRDRAADLMHADFDSKTVWPKLLPDGFDPALMMERNRTPGLGLRELHRKGVTGRGVAVAIIDQALLVGHAEYRDRVRLYEEIHDWDDAASMHGPAVASIAVGRTVGVAPEADLYFIAEAHVSDNTPATPGPVEEVEIDYHPLAESIDRIIEVSRSLPEGGKIRVISISKGWNRTERGYQALTAAIGRARKDGIFVVSCSLQDTYGLAFHALGRDPMEDPDQFSSYDDSSFDKYYLDENPGRPALLVPMNSRVTASPTGNEDYVFYSEGGWSWAVPYIAGLYALACQVEPDITPDAFWQKALETGDALDLPAKAPALSADEVDRRVAKTVNEAVDRVKAAAKGRDLEQLMGEVYSQGSGEKRERLTEAEFRALAEPIVRQRESRDSRPHRLGMIVNPARLMEALRK